MEEDKHLADYLANVLGILKRWLGKDIVKIDKKDFHHEEGKKRLVDKLSEYLPQITRDKFTSHPYPSFIKGWLKEMVKSLIEKLKAQK